MDNAISAIWGHSCAMNLSPFALHVNGTLVDGSTSFWTCQDTNNIGLGNPWGCHLVLSMGFLVALAITVPMGYFNLDDNMIVQVCSMRCVRCVTCACS